MSVYFFLYITQVLREGVFKDHKQEFDKINFLKSMSGVFFYVSQGYLRDLSTLPCSPNKEMFYV